MDAIFYLFTNFPDVRTLHNSCHKTTLQNFLLQRWWWQELYSECH